MADANDSDVQKEIHPLTDYPNKAWDRLKVKQLVKKVDPLPHSTPISEDKVRFVCVSDTHGRTNKMTPESMPPGDVLLHGGDFSDVGQPKQIYKFNEWLGSLPYKHKIVIAGNHDLTFDTEFLRGDKKDELRCWGLNAQNVEDFLLEHNCTDMKDVLTNCTYLEDSATEIYGIKIYGSPWSPYFGGWGFNAERGEECLALWNKIPAETDILMTHGPPIGHGDRCFSGLRAGCVELLSTIQKRVKPKFHIFGHIHEGYGVTTDDYTTYINASSCNLRYIADQPPIIFDVPLPEGQTKDDVLGDLPAV